MKIKVIAKKGKICPVEGRRGKVISDTVPMEVDKTAYYLRQLKAGDLLPWADPEQREAPKKESDTKKKEKK